METTKNKPTDKQEVRKVIDDFFHALSKKDIKGMMIHYAPDVVVYDVKPPFMVKGAVAWKHVWEACLPYFPDVFEIETRDLVIHGSAQVAVAHYLFRVTGPEKDHAAMQTWMRATTGFKFMDNRWKIVHEHGSLPYDPASMQAQPSMDPVSSQI